MSGDKALSPALQLSTELSAAAASSKGVMVGSTVATGGGFWAWLGINAPQIGLIIGACGLAWAIYSGVRQRKELKRIEDKYESLSSKETN